MKEKVFFKTFGCRTNIYDTELLKSYEIANPISQNYDTPAFVVNGKYQIVPSAINSPEALIEITKELSKQK